MNSFKNKTSYFINTLSMLRSVLEHKGVKVPCNVPLRKYPELINEVRHFPKTNFVCGPTPPENTDSIWVQCDEDMSKSNNAITIKYTDDDGVAGIIDKNSLYEVGNIPYLKGPIVAIDNNIYIFGGNTINGDSSRSQSIYKINLHTNRGERLDVALPDGFECDALAAVNTKIYLFGDLTLEFDVKNETITVLDATSPTKNIYNRSYSVVGNKIYFFGGSDDNSGFDIRRDIVVFDADTNSVTTLSTSLPNRVGITSAAVGTKIYLFGGRYKTTHYNRIEVFDTETYSISSASASLPKAMCNLPAVSLGTDIYLFGGKTVDTYESTIWKFDTITNNITNTGAWLLHASKTPSSTRFYTISDGRILINNVGYTTFGGYCGIMALSPETHELTSVNYSLPRPLSDVTSAVVDNKIYLFGGVHRNSNSGNEEIRDAYAMNIFDTDTNCIIPCNYPLLLGAKCISSAVVGHKIYLFGGEYMNACVDTINVFDTNINSVMTLDTRLPTGASDIASAVIGDKIYLFGGRNGTKYLDTINVFDTNTNSITTLDTRLPIELSGIASAVVGTKVYLFGGRNTQYRYKSIRVFDTEADTITTIDTTMSGGIYHAASAVIGNKIYLFGGNGNQYLKNIYVFDSENNSFTVLNTILPFETSGIASAVVGDKIYLFGGRIKINSSSSDYYLSQILIFDTSTMFFTNDFIFNLNKQNKNFLSVDSQDITINMNVESVYCGTSDGTIKNLPVYKYVDDAWVEM